LAFGGGREEKEASSIWGSVFFFFSHIVSSRLEYFVGKRTTLRGGGRKPFYNIFSECHVVGGQVAIFCGLPQVLWCICGFVFTYLCIIIVRLLHVPNTNLYVCRVA
jgi:hypothetical protein